VPGPVRIAVVGAGRMGGVHMRALAGARNARLAAVVEPVPAARERAAGEHGVPGYADVEALVAARAADAVVITAPTDLHLELVERCAAASLPVFCEKPCGTSAEQARAAAGAAEAAGVPLQVGYYRRFVPELAALKQRIDAGALGQLSLLTLHQWDEHPPGAEFERRSGGIVVDMGVHEIDQLRWLTGQEIEAAAAVSPAPGNGSSVAVALRLSGGTLAVVTLGRRFPHPDSCWMEAVGTHGYERLSYLWAEQGDAVMLAGVTNELDAFAAAATGAAPPVPGGADAVAALDAAAVIDRSLAAQA
jgi:myo-inositol 2-dehydrogenase / D-chiro-inositol 1-dehydrogenase